MCLRTLFSGSRFRRRYPRRPDHCLALETECIHFLAVTLRMQKREVSTTTWCWIPACESFTSTRSYVLSCHCLRPSPAAGLLRGGRIPFGLARGRAAPLYADVGGADRRSSLIGRLNFHLATDEGSSSKLSNHNKQRRFVFFAAPIFSFESFLLACQLASLESTAWTLIPCHSAE